MDYNLVNRVDRGIFPLITYLLWSIRLFEIIILGINNIIFILFIIVKIKNLLLVLYRGNGLILMGDNGIFHHFTLI